jgi:hypothetical protein
MIDAPTFEGRLYTDDNLHGVAGRWVRRAEYDAALDRIRELEKQFDCGHGRVVQNGCLICEKKIGHSLESDDSPYATWSNP